MIPPHPLPYKLKLTIPRVLKMENWFFESVVLHKYCAKLCSLQLLVNIFRKIIMKVVLIIIYNFICKIIIKLLPLLRILRLQTLVIDQLSKIRLGSNKYGNIQKVISELPQKRKLIALDVGAQGGLNMEHFF